ncbi:HPP family protein [Nocardia nepalensis]|uniref:CBS domain-containing protein n=1 Tax=Nocardia nepalensis TaxID=3375448 RepID=UPI003B67F572
MRARDILSGSVVTVRPEAPLTEAIDQLTPHGFAALPVLDDNDRVIGLTSESDALAASSKPDTAIVQAAMSVVDEATAPRTPKPARPPRAHTAS